VSDVVSLAQMVEERWQVEFTLELISQLEVYLHGIKLLMAAYPKLGAEIVDVVLYARRKNGHVFSVVVKQVLVRDGPGTILLVLDKDQLESTRLDFSMRFIQHVLLPLSFTLVSRD